MDVIRPPLPAAGHFGVRSVGAGGFPRNLVQANVQANGVLSDLDANSQVPYHEA